MSQFNAKSPKHCWEKHVNIDKYFKFKKFFWAFSTFLQSVLSFIILIYLILHPTKPDFSLKEAEIYQLNLLGPHLLNSIQLTLQSKNPNQTVGIYYDELQSLCYLQRPTDHSLHSFSSFGDSNILSASLIGSGVPVSLFFRYEVGRDQIAGKLVLNVKVVSRIRWKVGTWVSGRYRLNVNCVAILPFGLSIPTGPLSSNRGTQCSTII